MPGECLNRRRIIDNQVHVASKPEFTNADKGTVCAPVYINAPPELTEAGGRTPGQPQIAHRLIVGGERYV